MTPAYTGRLTQPPATAITHYPACPSPIPRALKCLPFWSHILPNILRCELDFGSTQIISFVMIRLRFTSASECHRVLFLHPRLLAYSSRATHTKTCPLSLKQAAHSSSTLFNLPACCQFTHSTCSSKTGILFLNMNPHIFSIILLVCILLSAKRELVSLRKLASA